MGQGDKQQGTPQACFILSSSAFMLSSATMPNAHLPAAQRVWIPSSLWTSEQRNPPKSGTADPDALHCNLEPKLYSSLGD